MMSQKVATMKHTSLSISIESVTHTKQATFLESTLVCFLGATFCDIINEAECTALLDSNIHLLQGAKKDADIKRN